MAQLKASEVFSKKMFAVVLRAGPEFGSQPLLTAMAGPGTTNNEMKIEELEEMAAKEGKFIFKKGIVKNGLGRDWKDILEEYEVVVKDAWDRFVQVRDRKGVLGELPHPPLKIDHSPVTYHDFATVAVQQNLFVNPENLVVIQAYEERFDGTLDQVHEDYGGNHNVDDNKVGGDIEDEEIVFDAASDVGGILQQAVADAFGHEEFYGGFEEVRTVRNVEGPEETEDDIDNLMENFETEDAEVKDHPTFRRMINLLEKKRKEFKELEKHSIDQGKQILILEDQVKEMNNASAQTILSGLIPTIKNEMKENRKKMQDEVTKSVEEANKMESESLKTLAVDIKTSNEDLKSVVVYNITTLMDVQKALMGGFGAFISCCQENKRLDQARGSPLAGGARLLTPTHTPENGSSSSLGPIVSRYNPARSGGRGGRGLVPTELRFQTPPGPPQLSQAERALLLAQTQAQQAMNKLVPMPVPMPVQHARTSTPSSATRTSTPSSAIRTSTPASATRTSTPASATRTPTPSSTMSTLGATTTPRSKRSRFE